MHINWDTQDWQTFPLSIFVFLILFAETDFRSCLPGAWSRENSFFCPLWQPFFLARLDSTSPEMLVSGKNSSNRRLLPDPANWNWMRRRGCRNTIVERTEIYFSWKEYRKNGVRTKRGAHRWSRIFFEKVSFDGSMRRSETGEIRLINAPQGYA